MTTPSSTKIEWLTNEGVELLGKHLVIQNLHLSKVDHAAAVTLNTRDSIQFAISEIEIFPYLLENSAYERRFKNENRSDGGVFAFQSFGAPLIAQILDAKSSAIAVVKRLIDANGHDRSWANVLQTLGALPAQFKGFIDRVDNVQANDEFSPLQFQATEQNSLEFIESFPDKKIQNLSSVLHIARESKKELMVILKGIQEKVHDASHAS